MTILESMLRSRWAEVYGVVGAVTAAVLFLGFFLSHRLRGRHHALLPGPAGWPILGSLLSLGPLPHIDLYKLSKKYGPLMSIRLGSVRMVVVTSSQLAEEVLKTQDQIWASRPGMIASAKLFYGGIDVGFAPYGPHWRYARKVCMVGLLTATRITQSREIREREILASLHYILEESDRGNAVNMAECFCMLNLNNMTQITMNKSYCDRTSGSKSALPSTSTSLDRHTIEELFMLLGSFNIADFVPILKPFDLQGLDRRLQDLHQRLDKFMDEIIDEHKSRLTTATPGNYKEDFVDALLGIGQTAEFQEKLSMDSVKAILLGILAAAGDGSANWAQWTLTELMRHPHMMKRVQEELDLVVGPGRLVQEEDLPELKYLTAVMKEAIRLHPPGPLLLPHQSTQDCQIQGFHIPANTRVMVNVWAIQRDPSIWERPLEFDPDRFQKFKDIKGQDFELLPFGSGRRMCPAYNLGTLMVLYPLAVLLHAVDFRLLEGQKPEELDMSEIYGTVLHKRDPLMVYGKSRLSNHVIYGAQEAPK